jgi:hypothetical protein
MKARGFSGRVGIFVTGWILTGVVLNAVADTIEMRNGDRYVGKVVAIDDAHIKLKNENLGVLQIDRQKVTTIHLGDAVATASAVPADSATATTNAVAGVKPTASASETGQAVIDAVRSQFLGAAGPEANQLFNNAAQGVLSGKTTVGDIRSQAQSAANEIRKLQKELGGEGDALDGYLSILDHFLSETRTVAPTTKASEIAR